MALFGKLLNFLGIKKKQASVLIVGLDNSGKTTVINQFKPSTEKSTEIVPTIGFTVEKFSLKSLNITAFDMSGQGRYRNLWELHYKGVAGVIFVIDSSDSLRMVVAKDELTMMTSHNDIKGKRIPILFLANKIDLPDSIPVSKISQILSLDSLDHPWNIQATNAVTGEGLEEGIEWLCDQLIKKNNSNSK